MRLSRYLSPAFVACFDGAPAADPNAAPPVTDPNAPPALDPSKVMPKTFTQEELNKILAEDRRKHQTTLEKTETTYKELLANSQNLSAQERATLEENLAVVQGQLRTKEQQAALEKKQLEEQYQRQLSEREAAAKTWETRYKDETVNRALLDAAVAGDAYNPNVLANELRRMSRIVENVDAKTGKPNGTYRTLIDFPDVDATTGEVKTFDMSPAEAVKRMRDLPEYANLFKSNVVSGLGANSSVNGVPAGANGQVDPSKLTHEQYRKLRKENPSALGLRPGGGRR